MLAIFRRMQTRGALFGILCILFLQVVSVAPVFAAQDGNVRLDVFGNPICVAIPDAGGGESGGHAGSLSCCKIGCSMFCGICGPGGLGSVAARLDAGQDLGVPAGFLSPDADGTRRTANPRAPPVA